MHTSKNTNYKLNNNENYNNRTTTLLNTVLILQLYHERNINLLPSFRNSKIYDTL